VVLEMGENMVHVALVKTAGNNMSMKEKKSLSGEDMVWLLLGIVGAVCRLVV